MLDDRAAERLRLVAAVVEATEAIAEGRPVRVPTPALLGGFARLHYPPPRRSAPLDAKGPARYTRVEF